MVLEKANIDADELLAVRDRELSESYESHHVAETILITKLQTQYGFTVVEVGDKAPEAEEVFWGDGPDLLVKDGGDDVCTIEIKTKREEHAEWYGRLNKRHYNDYVAKANEQDVPFLVYFAVVDMDCGAITREDVVEITGEEVDGHVIDIEGTWVGFDAESAEVVDEQDNTKAVPASAVTGVGPRDEVVDGIPDIHGNDVVCLDEDQFRSLSWVLELAHDGEYAPRVREVDDR